MEYLESRIAGGKTHRLFACGKRLFVTVELRGGRGQQVERARRANARGHDRLGQRQPAQNVA